MKSKIVFLCALTLLVALGFHDAAHAGIRIGEVAECAASVQDLYGVVFGAVAGVVGIAVAAYVTWSIVATLLSGGALWPTIAGALAGCVWRFGPGIVYGAWRIYLAIRAWRSVRAGC